MSGSSGHRLVGRGWGASDHALQSLLERGEAGLGGGSSLCRVPSPASSIRHLLLLYLLIGGKYNRPKT